MCIRDRSTGYLRLEKETANQLTEKAGEYNFWLFSALPLVPIRATDVARFKSSQQTPRGRRSLPARRRASVPMIDDSDKQPTQRARRWTGRREGHFR